MKLQKLRNSFRAMVRRYASGKASEAEHKFLNTYYDSFSEQNGSKLTDAETEAMGAEMRTHLLEHVRKQPGPRWLRLRPAVQLGAAAAVALIVAGLVFLQNRAVQPNVFTHLNTQKDNDILPGADAAMLTLSDGSQVALTGNDKPEILDPSGMRIGNRNTGELDYRNTASARYAGEYHKIETPLGGQYRLILPDGTKVWLNAGSSLRYPASFNARMPAPRQVELSGEAYFEVMHYDGEGGSPLPFKVQSHAGTLHEQTVEVLGTHFNINTYQDASLSRITLMEGSVRVRRPEGLRELKPGQQLLAWTGGMKVGQADLAEAIAWKNNQFMFNNTSLSDILRQLDRWYNIRTEANPIADRKRYSGVISRRVNLSEVLKMLELTGNVRFKLEDNRTLKVSLNETNKRYNHD
ncbi:FecR family protein [Pedobacter sp. SYP-B3415]|uniref:FecR family protein n=1 Tax=Pedobacter sp. SYP-B3415 TaxID=2496641 RepID=UPI00101C9B98|nr:FecR domain-containing protein [Pedobacter sp. SYP-B3415]